MRHRLPSDDLGQRILASEASNFFVNVNHSYFGVFAQDQYKVTPKLTVNYGLRYDVEAGLGSLSMATTTLPAAGWLCLRAGFENSDSQRLWHF